MDDYDRSEIFELYLNVPPVIGWAWMSRSHLNRFLKAYQDHHADSVVLITRGSGVTNHRKLAGKLESAPVFLFPVYS